MPKKTWSKPVCLPKKTGTKPVVLPKKTGAKPVFLPRLTGTKPVFLPKKTGAKPVFLRRKAGGRVLGRWGGSPGWVARVGRQGGSRWVARPLLLSLLSTRKSQPPATHPEQTDRQNTDRQTDTAPQPNPLPHRTQGPKYAARHPLALIFKISVNA